MICPTCGHDNLPGNEECVNCQQDLTPLDRPMAQDKVERSLMEDEVALLNPKAPVTVSPSTPLKQALQAMVADDIGALLVVDAAGNLLGVFTERDLLKKVVGVHDNYADLKVGDFMTPKPETITSTDTLNFALHKMDGGGYRHLPVLTNGKPAGVISVRDMVHHIYRLCKD
jgi:CBS domain-containing protein